MTLAEVLACAVVAAVTGVVGFGIGVHFAAESMAPTIARLMERCYRIGYTSGLPRRPETATQMWDRERAKVWDTLKLEKLL